MIVSVPHTGTRTLAKHLGMDYMHYGHSDMAIAKLDEHIHFPIRDPLAVTISWRIGERPQGIKNGDHRRDEFDEFRRWDMAIKHLKTVPHTIHKIEDLPVLEGISRRRPIHQAYKDRDMERIKQLLPEFDYLKRWIKDKDFFCLYYDLWWLK